MPTCRRSWEKTGWCSPYICSVSIPTATQTNPSHSEASVYVYIVYFNFLRKLFDVLLHLLQWNNDSHEKTGKLLYLCQITSMHCAILKKQHDLNIVWYENVCFTNKYAVKSAYKEFIKTIKICSWQAGYLKADFTVISYCLVSESTCPTLGWWTLVSSGWWTWWRISTVATAELITSCPRTTAQLTRVRIVVLL